MKFKLLDALVQRTEIQELAYEITGKLEALQQMLQPIRNMHSR